MKKSECSGLFSTLWQRTLNSRPHKNPPMGSRSAVLNAVLLKLVAKEKGYPHSFMIFQIRFNLLGGCFACRCFCSSASFCNFICSGIHFRAVGIETAISLTTAPQVPYKQQKGRQREPMGGFLWAVCLASGGSF